VKGRGFNGLAHDPLLGPPALAVNENCTGQVL
jgi:hypothetical protein